MELVETKPQMQKAAFELYGFKLEEGDERSIEHAMKEAYLDFQTKSLQPGHGDVPPYSKRVNVEIKEHSQI